MSQQNGLSDQPEIIRSQLDCQKFGWWLQNHPKIASVQGYRNEGGTLTNGASRLSNISQMWQERRALNDWIRTYRNQK